MMIVECGGFGFLVSGDLEFGSVVREKRLIYKKNGSGSPFLVRPGCVFNFSNVCIVSTGSDALFLSPPIADNPHFGSTSW